MDIYGLYGKGSRPADTGSGPMLAREADAAQKMSDLGAHLATPVMIVFAVVTIWVLAQYE